MHIAIVHGYLLEGTGSNFYVQNLCREFCRLGHQVSLFCQEGNREKYDFIARGVEFSPDNQVMETVFERETPFPGKCTAYRPDLGGMLPVYVFDHYAGYRVKEFTRLTVSEIEDYLRRNREAMTTTFRHSCPDLFLSNHLIMQPVYTVRTCDKLGRVPHFLTVHGSCLNFSVRKSPLLQKYALEAMEKTDMFVFVSNQARQEFLDFFHDRPATAQKTVVIPAGVDLNKFSPLGNNESKGQRIGNLVSYLRETRGTRGRTGEQKLRFSQAVAGVRGSEGLLPLLGALEKETPGRDTDTDTADRLAAINWQHDPVVLSYGKYLWTKGPQLLVAAAPLVLREQPGTYFVLVGFGTYRGYLEALVAALDSGRRDLFYDLVSRPQSYGRDVDPALVLYFKSLLQKLDDQGFAEDYFTAARGKLAKQILFTGYIGHDGLKDLIPCSEIAVAASVFPESFGMVAVEALASGIIPMQTNHSGFTDVIKDYVNEFEDLFDKSCLRPLFLDEDLILNLANNLLIFIKYYGEVGEQGRQQVRVRARRLAAAKYSWDSIASSYLAAYEGLVGRRP